MLGVALREVYGGIEPEGLRRGVIRRAGALAAAEPASFDEDGMYALPDVALDRRGVLGGFVRLPGGRIALKTLPVLYAGASRRSSDRPARASPRCWICWRARRRPGRVRGSVLLNGAAPSLCHPALVGYVPQDDRAFLGWLTVPELLRFSPLGDVLPLPLNLASASTRRITRRYITQAIRERREPRGGRGRESASRCASASSVYIMSATR